MTQVDWIFKLCRPNQSVMEILLLEDVKGIGKKDDILVVGDGYALNCLLPQRMALVATPTVRRRYAEQIRRRAEARIAEETLKSDTAAALAGKQVTFDRKVTKTGKLYAAITEKHIVDALKKQHKMEVDVKAIAIAEPIKALGEHAVSLKLGENEEELAVVVNETKE